MTRMNKVCDRITIKREDNSFLCYRKIPRGQVLSVMTEKISSNEQITLNFHCLLRKKESTKSQRREEESRNSKENLKRPRDEDSRRHQRVDKSPKQVKNPVNSSGFKIPLKPRQENRSRDNCPVLSSGSARKLDYGDRHDSNRRPPTDIIRRWNPSIRVNDRGLTREQQRWLERMPRHW